MHFYSVIFHTFLAYIIIHSRHFLSFVKGCSLAAESSIFYQIFNQRTFYFLINKINITISLEAQYIEAKHVLLQSASQSVNPLGAVW